MRVKLYHYPATRSTRVAFLLHELEPEISHEIVRLDLYRGEQYAAEFTDRFPLHAIPAVEIQDDDGRTSIMTESAAIITALADAFPEKALAPAAFPFSAARADYLRTIDTCGASLDMMLWQIRIHQHVLPEGQRDPRTVARYSSKISDEVAPMLAKRLDRTAHICGDDFSAADCMISHALVWARSYGLCGDDAFTSYLARLSERPAFQKAYADIAEFTPEVPEEMVAKGLFTG